MKHAYIKSEFRQTKISRLLTSAQKFIGLPLCINDDLNRLKLPESMRMHSNPFCMAVKKKNMLHCLAFCRKHVDEIIINKVNGVEVKCPFGGLQLASPIFLDGIYIATLFAGPHCHANNESTPKPAKTYLQDLRNIVASLARDISTLISENTPNQDRRTLRHNQIIKYINSNLSEGVSLEALAAKLHLSVSRTSHCVTEITGRDFTSLVTLIRKTRGTRYLLNSNIPIADIAYELGFCDQSHFTKFFKTHFKTTPSKYRKNRL